MQDILILPEIATLDISACSGCTLNDGLLCVVADDRHDLYVFDLNGERQHTIALFSEPLPEDELERKKVKADLEALCQLTDQQLLAIGSGSRKNRCRGALIDALSWTSKEVDLSSLYLEVEERVGELNIEGGAVVRDTLFLGQRGNSSTGVNALIQLDVSMVLQELESAALSGKSLRSIIPLQLGAIEGVPFSLTDLAPSHDGNLWFTGAAEDTEDPYLDGEIKGTIIGKMNTDGVILWQRLVSPLVKLEGVCEGPSNCLYLVSDADDPEVMSPLFQLDIRKL